MGEALNKAELQKIKSIAAQSNHPLSRSIEKSINCSLLDVQDFSEIPGSGIEGEVSGVRVRIGSSTYVGAVSKAIKNKGSAVYVSFDGQVFRRFFN